METINVLKNKLESINEKDYAAYQSLKGEYNYPQFKLLIDQIPKDPYAPPYTGIYRAVVKNNFFSQFNNIFNTKVSEIAFCDFLARNFYTASINKSKGRRGTGNSGIITIAEPGQVILERNSVVVNKEIIEVRFFIGLPADGRKINSQICKVMLLEELPEIIKLALFPENLNISNLEKHIKIAEDAEYLRSRLDSLNLVAFIADNSILPRKSGTSDKPLDKNTAIPFKSPESLLVEIDLPHLGKTKGMGIPKGITLIVGGGYHGKSTLLDAIAMGIYNHIPGDGREICISDFSTIKVRAYSGRYIEKVDISAFINNLPMQKNTARFSTENASGSTSQAASIMEAIEAGTNVFLMDEDTCAANFMIRDKKMQKLIEKDDEPITTFIDKVEELYLEKKISTVLVLGGIGDYFDVSNLVIQMKNYNPIDVTIRAHEISRSAADKRLHEGKEHQINPNNKRIPVKGCIDPYNDYNKKSVYSTEINRINFGRNIIDLTDMEQLIELSQTKAIGEAILYLGKYIDGKASLKEIIHNLMYSLGKNGLDVLSDKKSGYFAGFRGLELAFAVNRLREFKIENQASDADNHRE
jgi:predicted ABC-class ATPase